MFGADIQQFRPLDYQVPYGSAKPLDMKRREKLVKINDVLFGWGAGSKNGERIRLDGSSEAGG